jgi:hypothetical protein
MFYPANTPVPPQLRTEAFVVRPLRSTDVTLDYDAVVSSRAELWLRSENTWPREGFTLEENLADLVSHEQEHLDRVAFTYTVMNPAQTVCLGCIYIDPLASMLQRAGANAEQLASVGDYEAWTTFWVRQSRLADDLDARLLTSLLNWFAREWAFKRVAFAARKEQRRQVELFTKAGMHLLFELPRSLVYTLGV